MCIPKIKLWEQYNWQLHLYYGEFWIQDCSVMSFIKKSNKIISGVICRLTMIYFKKKKILSEFQMINSVIVVINIVSDSEVSIKLMFG